MNHFTFKLVPIIVVILAGFACSDENKKKAKVGTKVRSTGSTLLSLTTLKEVAAQYSNEPMLQLLADSIRSNSTVTLDYYKVPISRINLVKELKGTGYNGSSPDIYGCKGTTDAECLVDISKKSNVDNLLKAAGKDTVTEEEAKGAEQAEIAAETEITYNGVAVEFCHEFSSTKVGIGNGYYQARFKGSAVLAGKTYYTNSTSGLSTTSPAQEIILKVQNAGCGYTTPLLESVTVKEDTDVNIVLYTDPNGSIFVTEKKASNIACLGDNPTAICANHVAIFGTVDDKDVTVERYLLTMTDTTMSNVLATLIFNSDGKVFGAVFRNIFNDTAKSNILHADVSIQKVDNNSDGTLTFNGYASDMSISAFIKNFKRAGHSGSILLYVDKEQAYSASKL